MEWTRILSKRRQKCFLTHWVANVKKLSDNLSVSFEFSGDTDPEQLRNRKIKNMGIDKKIVKDPKQRVQQTELQARCLFEVKLTNHAFF